MLRILIPILLLLGGAIAGEITGFAEAKSEALRQNKPLLIDFMTTW